MSQRPGAVDDNILSQLGSVAVMQMTHKDDLRAIESVSESLSEELIKQLPSLNKGEAILAGHWVPTATFVKVDEVKERKVGTDIDAIEEWEQQQDDDNDNSSITSNNQEAEAAVNDQSSSSSSSYDSDGYTQDSDQLLFLYNRCTYLYTTKVK